MNNDKKKAQGLINTINIVNDSNQNTSDTLYSNIQNDLGVSNGVIGTKLSDGIENTDNKNIFEDLIDVSESFMGVNDININEKPALKNKLRQFGEKSATESIRKSTQIIQNEVLNIFYAEDEPCGTNIFIEKDTLRLAPNEFDFLNILKESPNSISGSIFYENDQDLGLIKMNKVLYEQFNNPTPYVFKNYNDDTLFNLNWDETTQEYVVNGLTTVNDVNQFIKDYYSSIETPKINDVLKQAMALTIQGDGNETKSFNTALNLFDRLATKIFSFCGEQDKNTPLNEKPNVLNDESTFFDFDDVEGINLDNEDNRQRRVLKFVDCNNFETPINKNHIEDFSYLIDKKNSNEVITNTLNKLSNEIYENTEQTIPQQNLQISLTGQYILNIPRAIISNVLSPKMLFPIVTLYKALNDVNVNIDIKEIMKKLSKLFFNIIKKIFWDFIKSFWGFIKKELLNFIKEIALKIIKDKLKRWKNIITALISILKKLLTTNINNCGSLYKTILELIEKALNVNINMPMPAMLLLLSDSLPGYSAQKAYMNTISLLGDAGIETDELYGRPNKLNSLVKSILEGHAQEMDANSYVKITLKQAVLPSTLVSTIITPGTVVGVGKVM